MSEHPLAVQHRRLEKTALLAVLACLSISSCATIRGQPPRRGDGAATAAVQPPVVPEADPQVTEQRFGHQEARKRREADRDRQRAAEAARARADVVEGGAARPAVLPAAPSPTVGAKPACSCGKGCSCGGAPCSCPAKGAPAAAAPAGSGAPPAHVH